MHYKNFSSAGDATTNAQETCSANNLALPVKIEMADELGGNQAHVISRLKNLNMIAICEPSNAFTKR